MTANNACCGLVVNRQCVRYTSSNLRVKVRVLHTHIPTSLWRVGSPPAVKLGELCSNLDSLPTGGDEGGGRRRRFRVAVPRGASEGRRASEERAKGQERVEIEILEFCYWNVLEYSRIECSRIL